MRKPADIIAALFRDPEDSTDREPRPIPVTKQLSARFARERDLGEEPEMVSGQIEAFSWASQRIPDRLQPKQPLVALMDGSPSQWDATASVIVLWFRRRNTPSPKNAVTVPREVLAGHKSSLQKHQRGAANVVFHQARG